MGAPPVVLADANTFRELFAISPPGQKVSFEVQRGSETIKVDVSPAAALPSEVPGDLPASNSQPHLDPEQKPATGLVEIKLAEEKNNCVACVPESYHPDIPHGVIIWLHGNGGVDRAALAARWKDVCEKQHLIVLAPQALDPNKWEPTEAAFVRKTLDDLLSHYNIDRSRIAIYGYQNSVRWHFLLASEIPIASARLWRSMPPLPLAPLFLKTIRSSAWPSSSPAAKNPRWQPASRL